ncbi:hypothetical protein CAC42_6797 [Sphaceloma murrayae]|uniref:F-box domain-containing protein n=1 Tax=Sphaceloma murrayae TaxID=2082308 RepID=A0A2K1QGJ6_9PEZI|nr:hypothetical protein CAC42_6797 [Sphaceloma murrayae]
MNDLPAEVKELVATQLSRPSDLKSLCLVAREWYHPAVKQLYSSIDLRLGGKADYLIPAMFNSRNAALVHVRDLTFGLQSYGSLGSESFGRAILALIVIVENLPNNTIHSFRWQRWDKLPDSIYKRLWASQKSLKTIQVSTLRFRDNVVATSEQLRPLLTGCTRLTLMIDSEQVLDVFHMALDNSLSIEALDIHWEDDIRFWHFTRRASAQAPKDAPRRFVDELFRSRDIATVRNAFACLHSLNLSQVEFEDVEEQWSTYLDLEKVRYLNLPIAKEQIACFGRSVPRLRESSLSSP